jgi:hypothetical protein
MVVLPQALSPRFTSIIAARNLDDAQARLKEMFRAPVPINSDCTFLSLTVGCSELADHALANAFNYYHLSNTAPACKEDLTNTLSPIFHACHLDRDNVNIAKHLQDLKRIAREEKLKDTTTKRKTDLQAYGQRATLPDLQRALGTTQYWAHCIVPGFLTNPNKPVIDRIATTYLGILRDEMGASFLERMIHNYPHCVMQIMSTLQGYQSMIQTFVNCVPNDFDELTIDPAIFQAPLEAAIHAARDLSFAINAKQPPPSFSIDADRIPPSTWTCTHPRNAPSTIPKARTSASAPTPPVHAAPAFYEARPSPTTAPTTTTTTTTPQQWQTHRRLRQEPIHGVSHHPH